MSLLSPDGSSRSAFRRSRRSLSFLIPLATIAYAGWALAAARPMPVSAPGACPGGTTTCRVGRIDNYLTSDGPETTSPSAALDAAMHNPANCEGIVSHLDSIPTDQCMGHSWIGCWANGCVAGATLRFHARGGPDDPATDDLLLGEDATPLYSVPFSTLRSIQTGGADASWDPGDDGTFVLELGALPPGTGSRDILSSLQDGDLDILLQDDTMVDYFEITIQNGSVPTISTTWGSVKAIHR